MQRIFSDGLWNEIKRLAGSRGKQRAAVAYVSDDTIVKFGEGDLLVADATDGAISSGQTSALLIEKAFERGTQVFSLEGLHSKVMLFGDTAVIGSANISKNSVNLHVEAGLVTDNPGIVSMARAFVEAAKQKAVKVDDKFIARIKKIKVVRGGWAKGKNKKKKKNKVLDPGNQYWLVGVPEGDFSEDVMEKIEKGEQEAEKKKSSSSAEIEFIYCFSNDGFRKSAKPGDLIVMMKFDGNWRNGRVYRHARIIHRKGLTRATCFYLEMPRGYARSALDWRQFKALAKRVGITARIKPWTSRRIRERDWTVLYDAWGKKNP
jgi:hypothetical protein